MADPLLTTWLLGAVGDDEPSTLAVLLLGFGIMLAVFLLLRHQWRRKSGQPVSSKSAPSERIEEIRQRADTNSTTHQAMADATALAQRLGAHLDNKAEQLEQLLEQAERTIQRLERAQAAHAKKGADPDDSESSDVDPATRQIYALADQGLDPIEIAQKLDQHLGKVQLVLALRRA